MPTDKSQNMNAKDKSQKGDLEKSKKLLPPKRLKCFRNKTQR